MCKMILYMEQYIITAYSNLTRDPNLVPNCERPDTKSCDWIKCSFNSSDVVIRNHSYQFLRCAKPQAARLVFSTSSTTFNKTFDQSQIVQMDETTSVNVTIKHPPDQTLGLQVGAQLSQYSVHDQGIVVNSYN